ncbi:MAG: FAD-dependent oxidoreductase [Rhizobiales bacterium]|nr:FAD-dependent oxidoreductase [Hyphomicrobiales bacterium]
MKTAALTPDICVVGAGSAGLTVAAAAAAFKVPTVLIERGRMGGDCLNTGCVPSKALIAASRHMHTIGEAGRFGIRVREAEVDFAAVMDHVHGVIAAIAPNDSAERFTGLGVQVIRGEARFKDRRTIVVETEAGATEVSARRFVVATGSGPAIPPIPGLDTAPYLTNETIFELREKPAHLVVIGGGPIGLEMAQAFRRLGSKVTVLEAGKALSRDDPELAALLLEGLRAEGMEIREGATVTRVARREGGGVRATVQDGEGAREIEGTHLLVAAGRKPHLEGLGLTEAGIAFDKRGVTVDRSLRTSNRQVYAIGDVSGGPQFTHWAGYQAGLVVRSILFRFGGRVKDGILPWVTFTDPELAHVGLTEDEALKKGGKVQVLRWPFSENDRAQTERATRGLVKVLAGRNGRILGVDILGRDAGELIAPWVLAISDGMRVKSLASAVFPYPTRSESARRAAIGFYTPKLASPWIGRAIRLFRRFG